MIVSCAECGTKFDTKPVHIRTGRGKFCSRTCKGSQQSRTCTGANNPFYGRHHSKATKEKLRTSSQRLAGEHNPQWKGGTGGKYWTRRCLERDNYTCLVCGLRDPEIMQVDHIKPTSTNPELRFVLDNLRSICPNCHERKSRREKRPTGAN